MSYVKKYYMEWSVICSYFRDSTIILEESSMLSNEDIFSLKNGD